MLACFAFGSLMQGSSLLHILFGCVGLLLFLLVVAKVLLFPKAVEEDLQDPVLGAIAATFPMSFMVGSTYVEAASVIAGCILWYFGFCLHVALIVRYTVHEVRRYRAVGRFCLEDVSPAWFVLGIGILTTGIISPAYHGEILGRFLFWWGILLLIPLLIVVTWWKIRLDEPEIIKPMTCIYTAPASMCIGCFLSAFPHPNPGFATLLYLLQAALYFFALFSFIRCCRLPFYPSYASFTFPFVISAIASQRMAAFALGPGVCTGLGSWVPELACAEAVIAGCLVVYVLVRYLVFLFHDEDKPVGMKSSFEQL